MKYRYHPAEAGSRAIGMTCLKPEQRRQTANIVRKGLSKKMRIDLQVQQTNGIEFCKRVKHCGRKSFRDLPRRTKKVKITRKIEDAIFAFRTEVGEQRG
ncbi:MAG: hypothetical protein ACUVQM_06325 [Candidatus Hadarchaeaceae archaeon]